MLRFPASSGYLVGDDSLPRREGKTKAEEPEAGKGRQRHAAWAMEGSILGTPECQVY